jgi:hypothetical protein
VTATFEELDARSSNDLHDRATRLAEPDAVFLEALRPISIDSLLEHG